MRRNEGEQEQHLPGLAASTIGTLLREAEAVVWQRELGSGRLRFVAPEIESLLGYPAHRWVAEPGFWESIIHPDDRLDAEQRMRDLLADPAGGAFSYRAVADSGRFVSLTDTVLGGPVGERSTRVGFTTRGPRSTSNTRMPAALRVAEDSPARRRTEDLQQLLATALEATREAIVLVRLRDGIVIEANRSWCELTGQASDEVRGRAFTSLGVMANPDEVRRLLEAVRTGRHFRDAWLTIQLADGQYRHLQMAAERVILADEPHMLAHGSDMTEQLSLEQQQRQSQKMEALGRLAGGIAHDFNNLLTVISSFAQLAEEDLADGESVREALREIHRASFRAAELTGTLLSFSRGSQTERTTIDIDLTIEELQRMLGRVIGTEISVVHEPSERSALVTANRGELEQVLVNLVVNSRDAMPNGGTIVIAVGHLDVDREGRLSPDGFVIPPGRYVLIDVRDSGGGIPGTAREHVFEPFFSTKPRGEGTGLGLSTAYGIVRQHGGHIWFDSVPGTGTTFHVVLPETASDD